MGKAAMQLVFKYRRRCIVCVVVGPQKLPLWSNFPRQRLTAFHGPRRMRAFPKYWCVRSLMDYAPSAMPKSNAVSKYDGGNERSALASLRVLAVMM